MSQIDRNEPLSTQAKKIIELREEIKSKRKKKNYNGSKLRKYFAEAKELREDYNFSFADLSLWLRQYKRVKLTPDGVRSAYNRIAKEIDK